MKVLSILNYSRENKTKVISSIIPVLIAVSFLYLINTFVKSEEDSLYKLNIFSYKYHSTIMSCNNSNIITKVKSNKNVERLVPFMLYGIKYSIPGNLDFANVISLKTEDMNYFLEKESIQIKDGRLPQEGEKEIAINYLVAQNKKVTIGDNVGNASDKFDGINGTYKVVGILEGDSMISIVAFNNEILKDYEDEEKSLSHGIMIFPKKNSINEVNKLIENLPKGEAEYNTLKTLSEKFYRDIGSIEFLDAISILSIFLMVITVGSSKYVEFFNRKEEIGILNVIGYEKKQILKRAILEVTTINVISYVLGLLLGIVLSYWMKKSIFESIGAVGVVYDKKALLVSLYVPLFTILFTIVPINGMINKLDPIDMIENN
ncbi:FtsX-like permease family protein [Clostridiaceae bacterium UIB06]|uniref:FtsX-like permease family protein n=1 Tax=Clostridium thailandense TaxID=2794346 RepID=A0A949U107_9CLOT|nr:FtsX-like permease family protein [Clostridium thailandense]MCH5136094.1 FtsX-like permease family protein [Clostridiaceae bacterium UIB06]